MDFLLLTRPGQRPGRLRRLRLSRRAGWSFFLARHLGFLRFQYGAEDYTRIRK